jgi:hypothetical protein
MVNGLCEDTNKNNLPAGYNDTLTKENHISILNSPNHAMDEIYAYVEKYLYDLQISYAHENPCCNHDANETMHYVKRKTRDGHPLSLTGALWRHA